MSSNRMSTKFIKSILLSTTLLVSSTISEHNASFASDPAFDHEKQIRPNKLREILGRHKEVSKEGAKYISDINEKYALEEKKTWILDALSVLKSLTDYTRSSKYSMFQNSNLELNPINLVVQGWDAEKMPYNAENLEFYLFTPTYKGMMAYQDISEGEVTNIVKLLDLRLAKKAAVLDFLLDINRFIGLNDTYNKVISEALEDGKIKTNRGDLLAAIFDGNGTKIDEKNKLLNFVQLGKESFEEKINDRKYKIKLNYVSSGIVQKIKDIQSRVDGKWEIYLKGIEFLKCMKVENKQKFRDNMKTTTLVSNMERIKDIDLFTFYLVQKYKTIVLENVNDYVYPKCAKDANLLSNKLANEELENDREILLRGEEIHKIPNKFTLPEKRAWILEACALLKEYESYVDDLMYGPFDLNHCTYLSWDDSKGSFILNSLKIGTSFENDNTSVYTQLTDIDEWFIDQTILPELLILVSKEHHENILWKQVKNPQHEPQNLKAEEKPIPRMILEIFNIFEQNNRFLQINSQLFFDYIRKNSFIETNTKSKYAHGHNDISKVVLEKLHPENRLKLHEKLDKLSGYAAECMKKVNVIKMLTADRLGAAEKDHEKRMYQTFFIDFVDTILKNYTKEDIQQVYKIVTYQQDLFYQFYALINSDLSKNSPVPVPLEQLTSKTLNGGLNGGFSEEKKKVEPPKNEKKEEVRVMFISASNAQRETTRDRLRLKIHKQEIKKLLIETEEIVEKANGYKAKSSIQIKDSQLIRSEAERKAIEEELTAKPQISSKKSARKHAAPPKNTLPKDTNKQKVKTPSAKINTEKKSISLEKTEAFKLIDHNGKQAVVVQGFPMTKTEPKKSVLKLEKTIESAQIPLQNILVSKNQSPIKEVKTTNVEQTLPQNIFLPQTQSPIKGVKTTDLQPDLPKNFPQEQNQSATPNRKPKNIYIQKRQPQIVTSLDISSINGASAHPSTFVPEVIKAENKGHSWSSVVQNVDSIIDPLPIVPHGPQNQDVEKTEVKNCAPKHNINYISRSLLSDNSDTLSCVLEKVDIHPSNRLRVQIDPNPSDEHSNLFRGPLKSTLHIHHSHLEGEKGVESSIHIDHESDGKFDNLQKGLTLLNISLLTNSTQYVLDQIKFFMEETKSKLNPLVFEISATDLKGADKIIVEITPANEPNVDVMHWYQGHKK